MAAIFLGLNVLNMCLYTGGQQFDGMQRIAPLSQFIMLLQASSN